MMTFDAGALAAFAFTVLGSLAWISYQCGTLKADVANGNQALKNHIEHDENVDKILFAQNQRIEDRQSDHSQAIAVLRSQQVAHHGSGE